MNEAPYDLQLDNDTIPEDLEPGQAFAVLLAKDPDNEIVERQNITYSITELNSSVSHFELVNGSVLVAKTSFDYEMQSKYILNVTATDSGTPPLTVWKIIKIQASEERQLKLLLFGRLLCLVVIEVKQVVAWTGRVT